MPPYNLQWIWRSYPWIKTKYSKRGRRFLQECNGIQGINRLEKTSGYSLVRYLLLLVSGMYPVNKHSMYLIKNMNTLFCACILINSFVSIASTVNFIS